MYKLFLIFFVYLISGLLADHFLFDPKHSVSFPSVIIFILSSYILIKIFHIINKLFPLKYLAYRNTYKILMCYFVVCFLLGIVILVSYNYGIVDFNYFVEYFGWLLLIYYTNFLFILYFLYTIKNYNKYYGTFLFYNSKYSFFIHLIFLFIYLIILSILLLIVMYIDALILFAIMWNHWYNKDTHILWRNI